MGYSIYSLSDSSPLTALAYTEDFRNFERVVLIMSPENKDLHAEIFSASKRKSLLPAQQLSEVLESIKDGFFNLDQNWLLTYVNYRAAYLLNI